MVRPEDLGPHVQTIVRALITYTPEHFKTGFCRVEQAKNQAAGRFRYAIGSKELPDQGTSRPSPELHDAVHQLARVYAREGESFPGIEASFEAKSDGGFKTSLELLGQDAPPPSKDADESLWQAVYSAREAFYVEHFGPMPAHIMKLMNLSGVWPGGGLFAIESTKMNGLGITTSFGLSNPDMPTPVMAENMTQERGDGGNMTYSSTIVPRTPRFAPPEDAGYGYELMIVTPRPEAWAMLPVSWFVQTEILRDVDLLDRVREIGGLTVEEIRVGQEPNDMGDFLVAPAAAPFPTHAELPNGKMTLLIATLITRDEMKFALKNGQPALLDRLAKSGVGQISTKGRKSVV
jgi:hypothetical protein